MGGKPEPFQMFWSFVGGRRDAGVAVVQAAVEGHGWRVGGLMDPSGHLEYANSLCIQKAA